MDINLEILNSNEISKIDMENIIKIWSNSFNIQNESSMSLLEETSLLILKKNKEIIGFLFFLFLTRESLESNKDIYINLKKQKVSENDCYIYNLCIKEENRKNGYASLLLNKISEYSSSKKKIILFVEKGNIPAIKLYNKLNYSVKLATPNGFVMEKNIGQYIS